MSSQKTGNILSVDLGIVVQGCNAQGVMGSGLALQIKKAYPDVFLDYKNKQKASGLRLGEVVFSPPSGPRRFWVANAITQKFYGRDPLIRYVDYDAVRSSFKEIADLAQKEGIPVHYPQIGAGLGNGDWGVLSKIIEEELKDVENVFWMFPQPSAPQKKSKL